MPKFDLLDLSFSIDYPIKMNPIDYPIKIKFIFRLKPNN